MADDKTSDRNEGADDDKDLAVGNAKEGRKHVEKDSYRNDRGGDRDRNTTKKERRRHDDSDNDSRRRKKRRKSHEDEEDEEDSHERRRRRKHSKESDKKKKKSSHHRKDKERRRKHRSRSYRSNESDSDASSSESDDTDHSRRRKKHRKSKERHNDDDSGDHRRHKKKQRERRSDDSAGLSKDEPPDFNSTFGKFGIIKASDYHKQQRSFDVWMAEVKGFPSFTGPKWELQKYFQEYMEDFNTATLPHVKYYHYEQWEMEEYNKQQQLLKQPTHGSGVLQDEARHRQEMLEKARLLKQQELELAKASLNPEKIQEMKQQLLLKTEMAHAFKTGDKEKFARLQRRLEPDPK